MSGRAQQCLVTTRPIPATSTVTGVPNPHPHTAGRQESGPVRGLCQVLFILFPQKHLVRGQLLGGSHDTAAGVVRHGTARYGTVRGHYGWHRAQQTRTPSQCSEGAHPASHLPLETAPSRARPSVFAPPAPPPCPADCHNSGWGPGPAGGAARPRSWQARRQGGGCAGAARLAPAGVSVPRAIYTLYKYLQREEWRGRQPAGGTLSSALVIGRERRRLRAGPGLSSVGLPPGSPSHSRRPAPSLGHRQSSRRGICHQAWASRGSRVLDHKCINLLRAFSTAMD